MPVLAAGAALAAVGAGLSYAGNQQAQSAINAARSKSMAAQQEFQRKAGSIFNNQLPNETAQSAQSDIAKGAAERQNVFGALKQLSNPAETTQSPLQSAAVKSDLARTTMQGNAWSNALSQAQSKLGGYGDWSTALGVQNSDVNRRIGVINNESSGTARILPLEIQAASHKGDALSSWGRIVGALGSVVSAGSGSLLGAGTSALSAIGPEINDNGGNAYANYA